MASQEKGSLVLKALIVIAALGLWAAITIPSTIWSQEDEWREQSQQNMVSIHEAQRFHHKQTNRFVPTDSLENLLSFIASDSILSVRKTVGNLTNSLFDQISNVLSVPTLAAMLPISQSISEINSDLKFNARYFKTDENLKKQQEDIATSMRRFEDSADFPNFVLAKTYLDSLFELRDRIEDYDLQTTSLRAQRYTDSLKVYMASTEKQAMSNFWTTQSGKIATFIRDIKSNEALLTKTTVADRLGKFIDRIGNAVTAFNGANSGNDQRLLGTHFQALSKIRDNFINQDNFLVTQNRALLSLSETDSILVKLTRENFFDPDDTDGEQRYLVSYADGNANVTVESPNLMDDFSSEIKSIVKPLENLAFYPSTNLLLANLDSTINVMNTTKTDFKLNKFSGVILKMKEVGAEIKDLDNVLGFRYMSQMQDFVKTAMTSKQLSVLKPSIEEILNPMDTLATRINNRDIRDIEKRMQYFSGQFGEIDSLIAAVPSRQLPDRTKEKIPSLQDQFNTVFTVLDEVKSSFKAGDAEKLTAAGPQINNALLTVLNGHKQRVYGVFNRKHENHGYVNNYVRSWEEDKTKDSE
ncbi:MAG: hypothetical protein ACRBF0_23375 [Calditrichia bacterium]